MRKIKIISIILLMLSLSINIISCLIFYFFHFELKTINLLFMIFSFPAINHSVPLLYVFSILIILILGLNIVFLIKNKIYLVLSTIAFYLIDLIINIYFLISIEYLPEQLFSIISDIIIIPLLIILFISIRTQNKLKTVKAN